MNKQVMLVFLVGCGDGVVFGSNLMPGGMMKFEENWIGLASSFDKVDLSNGYSGVDVDGLTYFGLADLNQNGEGEYATNPDQLTVTDGVAWYEASGDEAGQFDGRIFVSDEDDRGLVGKAADKLYEYGYSCVGYNPDGTPNAFEYDAETDTMTLTPEIKGDYLIFLEASDGGFYVNMDGWKMSGGQLVISGDADSSPAGSWCSGTLWVYADPPEEDTDPWDEE